jgi:hypothetical protein
MRKQAPMSLRDNGMRQFVFPIQLTAEDQINVVNIPCPNHGMDPYSFRFREGTCALCFGRLIVKTEVTINGETLPGCHSYKLVVGPDGAKWIDYEGREPAESKAKAGPSCAMGSPDTPMTHETGESNRKGNGTNDG